MLQNQNPFKTQINLLQKRNQYIEQGKRMIIDVQEYSRIFNIYWDSAPEEDKINDCILIINQIQQYK